MADWHSELSEALASGNPALMKTALARVPKPVLLQALPSLHPMARGFERDGQLAEALSVYDALVDTVPERSVFRGERARVLLRLQRPTDAADDARVLIEQSPDQALGHRLQAEACTALNDLPAALAAWRMVARIAPNDASVPARVQALEAQLRKEAVLRQVTGTSPEATRTALESAAAASASASSAERSSPPSPPSLAFDPAWLRDPTIPDSIESFRVDGLRQHLWRYSAQLSPSNAIARLDDPQWLAAWDAALADVAGASVLFHGSELGVLGLRALAQGATHVQCVESYSLDERIAMGMVQKHFLGPWHAQHGAAIQGWSEEQRRASFEAFASRVDVSLAGSDAAELPAFDLIACPQIDHTLLGTGLVKAVRGLLAKQPGRQVRVLPARARVHAMAVRWTCPDLNLDLPAVRALRWSAYPQPLDLGPEFWAPLTEAVCIGEIDFANFKESTWAAELPVTADGEVDAIVSWFELDLGVTRLSSAPGGGLRCIKPAVHYTDPLAVQQGSRLGLSVQVAETRLSFHTQPAAKQPRRGTLASWYLPMLGDRARNAAYRAALQRSLAAAPAELVLDIGAGFGLLSAMAAEAGAARVVGCESSASIAAAGHEFIARHPLAERMALIHKDCRQLSLPEDLPQRADLAVFELFDCSLIGEGVLHFLAHAREHLLAPNARVLPARARIRAVVVEQRFDTLLGVDANLLNPYRSSPAFSNVDASTLNYRALSEPFDVFSFDFASATPQPEELALTVPAIASGTAGAVLFWFDLGLDDAHWVSNAPGSADALHWRQGLQALAEVRVEAGLPLPLKARHNGSSLQFQWQPEGLPQDAFSKLPRWDPRWLAASSELEQATQGLLQHCAQNPDEYAKVAGIAMRFAVNPAAHGLDPTIAQRFASMFMHGAAAG